MNGHNVCRCACAYCYRYVHCHGEFCKSRPGAATREGGESR